MGSFHGKTEVCQQQLTQEMRKDVEHTEEQELQKDGSLIKKRATTNKLGGGVIFSCSIFEFSLQQPVRSSNWVISNPTAVSTPSSIALNNMFSCTQPCLVYCNSHLAVLTGRAVSPALSLTQITNTKHTAVCFTSACPFPSNQPLSRSF